MLQLYWALCYADLWFYLDSSCTSGNDFLRALDDTIEWAEGTYDRIMNAATDDAFLNAFKILFHVDLMSPDTITVPLLFSFTDSPQGFMRCL